MTSYSCYVCGIDIDETAPCRWFGDMDIEMPVCDKHRSKTITHYDALNQILADSCHNTDADGNDIFEFEETLQYVPNQGEADFHHEYNPIRYHFIRGYIMKFDGHLGSHDDDNDKLPETFAFFDIDEEIRKLVESTSMHRENVIKIETDYGNKHNEILAKIEKLRAQLAENHNKKYAELDKARTQYDEDNERLAALRRQKAEEEANKAFEDTVILIKEICQDFQSWSQAREYQVEDVVRIVHQYLIGSSGVMNANEMALGKTFESLVALYICTKLHIRKTGKEPTMLWLTKVSIVNTGGTFNEARRWFPELKIFPIKGSDNKASREMIFEDFAAEGGICVLTNYETVKNTPAAQKIHWDFVIMDEVHKLKGGANANGPTAIWESIKDLSIGFQMMLTGTPLVNKIEEIWSYLHLFDRHAFPDARRFARQFSAFRDMSGVLQFSLQSERLLKDILKGRLIRRTATEVGLQLPPVNEQDIILPWNLEQETLYTKMRDEFFIWLEKQEKALSATSILAQLTRLRQINVLPVANFKSIDANGNEVITRLDVRDSSKLDEAVEIIKQTADQVIVFCTFNEPLEELAFRLQVEGLNSAIINSKYAGKMGEYETEFQAGKIDVLLINAAMGEGLNLHKDKAKWEGGARAVIMLDRWWNNARNRQCVARAVRPGENAGEPVFVYNLYCDNSVDFFIKALCDDKSAQFDALTESSELRPSSDWKNYLQGLL